MKGKYINLDAVPLAHIWAAVWTMDSLTDPSKGSKGWLKRLTQIPTGIEMSSLAFDTINREYYLTSEH